MSTIVLAGEVKKWKVKKEDKLKRKLLLGSIFMLTSDLEHSVSVLFTQVIKMSCV